MRRTRAARDHADPGPTRQLPVRIRHIGGANFVTARDEPEPRIVERVEHGEVALARNAEGNVSPVHDELVDDELSARPHRSRRGCSR